MTGTHPRVKPRKTSIRVFSPFGELAPGGEVIRHGRVVSRARRFMDMFRRRRGSLSIPLDLAYVQKTTGHPEDARETIVGVLPKA